MKTALLLSGGMDSTCIAFWKRPQVAITIDYGQEPAKGEIRAAKAVCNALQIDHQIISADISTLGSGDMAGEAPSDIAPATEWWPYRNQFLISVAAMKCHQLGAGELMVGALRTDGFHVDSTPAFFESMNGLLELQEGEMSIIAPAIELSAAELVRKSEIPETILAWSHSCHIHDVACGFCRGCQKHFETMEEVYGRPY